METKRLAFPRFYFVSAADLLDILSKGNQPVEVSYFYPFITCDVGDCRVIYILAVSHPVRGAVPQLIVKRCRCGSLRRKA